MDYKKSISIRCAENGVIVNVSYEKPALTMDETSYENDEYVFGFSDINKATAKVGEVLSEAKEYYEKME